MEERFHYAIGVSGPEDNGAEIQRKLAAAGRRGWKLLAVATHSNHTIHYFQQTWPVDDPTRTELNWK